MSEGTDELAYHLMRAMRLNCEVTFRYRREWLGIGVEVRKEHKGMTFQNRKIISDKEMVCVSDPMELLAWAIRDLTNSILDIANIR